MRDADRALNFGEIEDDDGDLRRELRHVDDHARGFFSQLSQARQSRQAFDGRLGDERLRIGPDWFGDIVDDGVALIDALDRVSSAMARFGGGDEAAPGSKASEDAAAIARRAAEIADNLRFLLAASDSSFVYFLETRGRGVFLRAAPIDVSRLVREFLVDRMHATVLTSATLTVEGSFEYVKGRLGLDDVSEVRVPSEFDFAEQSVLYLPQRMPSPKVAGLWTGGGARSARAARVQPRARLRALHQLRDVAHGARSDRAGAAVSACWCRGRLRAVCC